MWLQHFFIEGRPLGTATRGLLRHNATGFGLPPSGYAFFCSAAGCGRIWAACPIEKQGWRTITIPCGRHAFGWFSDEPAGSLWLPWDEDFTNALPLAVIKREFDLHLTHAAKEIAT